MQSWFAPKVCPDRSHALLPSKTRSTYNMAAPVQVINEDIDTHMYTTLLFLLLFLSKRPFFPSPRSLCVERGRRGMPQFLRLSHHQHQKLVTLVTKVKALNPQVQGRRTGHNIRRKRRAHHLRRRLWPKKINRQGQY